MATITRKIATAVVAAAVGVTGFAPVANADILGILGHGISISAGEQSDYQPSTTRNNNAPAAAPVIDTGDATSPLAADLAAATAPKSNVDLLKSKVSGNSEVWGDDLYRSRALEIAALVNRQRTSQGQNPIRLDENMSKASQAWAVHMADFHWFAHDPATRHGEIIAQRYNIDSPDTAAELIRQWENSAPHAELLHAPQWKSMGVGIAHDERTGEVYGVVRFSRF